MTSDETRMREALECLRAKDDLAEKVLERAAAPRRRARRGGLLPLALVAAICAAVLLATGGVAYAVATSGFFQRAFGDHGMGERSEWSLTTDAGSLYEFSREFSDVVSEKVVEDLEGAIEEVGLTTQGNGYTLTVENMVVDENGCGAVTFTLENPDGLGVADGVGMLEDAGQLWFTGSESLDYVSMGCNDDVRSFPNSRIYYEADSLTETSVHATMYFDSFGGLESVLSGVRWRLTWHTGELETIEHFEAVTDWFRPTKVVDARELSGDGASASISPFSVTYRVASQGEGHEFVTDHVSLELADGSELVVCDKEEGVTNTYTDTLRDDMFTGSHTFSQLVDVSQVERMIVRGHLCEGAEREVVEFTLTSAA